MRIPFGAERPGFRTCMNDFLRWPAGIGALASVAIMSIAIIHASPSDRSRSAALSARLAASLREHGAEVDEISLRELPAEELLHARADALPLRNALRKVERARAVVVATPIYKAAYSGLLKVFLDLLPQDALAGKSALALATGGSAAHYLALDYALGPVFAALGARTVHAGVYVTDDQWQPASAAAGDDPHARVLEPAAGRRLERAVADLLASIHTPRPGRAHDAAVHVAAIGG